MKRERPDSGGVSCRFAGLKREDMRNKPVQITRNRPTKIEPVATGESILLRERDVVLLRLLADVLEYPTKHWNTRFEELNELCLVTDRSNSEFYSAFYSLVRETSLLELQELYTRTFDLSPVCALEVGYHLFGEDYKRGAFLAQLRETENPYELGQEHQLPDFLPILLRLLGQMEDAELRASLIGYCLLPALAKMSEQLRKKKNRYGNLIYFVEEVLSRIAAESVQEPVETAFARI